MAQKKTSDFLPDIFQTDTNRKFLSSTLDQLVNDVELTKLSGFVGRKFAPTNVNANDYIVEPTQLRQNYQLEPSFVNRDSQGRIVAYGNYIDLINRIEYNGGIVNDHDRLFNSEYYTFEPHVDLDKLINYSQYYWLPNFPDEVIVGTGTLSEANDYVFASNANSSSYTSTVFGNITNPTLTMVRGETYTITVNHAGEQLWIQTEPGVSGTQLYNSSLSTRLGSEAGVTANGISQGVIVFTPPARTAQNIYLDMPLEDYTDFAVANTFTSIDGLSWNANISLDGDNSYPRDRFIIFTNLSTNTADWTTRLGQTVPVEQRHGLWRIDFSANVEINLTYIRNIDVNTRIQVRAGASRGRQFYKNSQGNLIEVPLISAPLTRLYYQNSARPGQYGIINIIETPADQIDVETEITGNADLGLPGQINYTAPNGVEFTNGLRVTFDDSVVPTSYRGQSYIVEGVGSSIQLIDVRLLDSPESRNPDDSIPFDQYNFDVTGYDASVLSSITPEYIMINRASQEQSAWSRGNRWFHVNVIQQTARYNGLVPNLYQLQRAQRPIIEFKPNRQLYNSGRVGLGLVDEFLDTGLFIDGVSLIDIAQINNAEFATLLRNNINVKKDSLLAVNFSFDDSVRRTIYRVNYLDQTSAVTFAGTLTGTIDTDTGSAVIRGTNTDFLNQLDVGDDIYLSNNTYLGRVGILITATELVLETATALNLAAASGLKFNRGRVSLTPELTGRANSMIAVRSGVNAGRSYYLDTSIRWVPAQRKTSLNQEPLFDLVDSTPISLSQTLPESEFHGTKIFSYARGSSLADPVLGFSLSYRGLGNSTGDIIFDNNYEIDEYLYRDSSSSTRLTAQTRLGFIKVNSGYTAYRLANSWNTVNFSSQQYQIVTNYYDGLTSYFEIDCVPRTEIGLDIAWPNVKVYINNTLLAKTRADTLGTALTTTVSGAGSTAAATAVNDYYLTYLSRYAEQGGLDYWVGVALATDLATVENAIRYSYEAFTQRSFLISRIGSSYPETTIITGESSIISYQVQQAYLTFLGRWANQTEVDQAVNRVLNSETTVAGVEAELQSMSEHTEFVNRALSNYAYELVGNRSCIRINYDLLTVGDRVDIFVYSNDVSSVGYYQIPGNLEFNTENRNIQNITFGQLTGHLKQIGENVRGLVGNPLSLSNLRDLNTARVGGIVQQQSSPLHYAMAFMFDRQINFFSSIDFARREYTRFRNRFLEAAITLPGINPDNVVGSVDAIIAHLNSVKNISSPWYYSDMIPHGSNYSVLRYKVLNIAVRTYNLSRSYFTDVLSSRAVMIYLNNQLLIRDVDVFFNAGPTFTISTNRNMAVNDILEIREYESTDGNYIPETPTKLGLHPKFVPQLYLDSTLRTPENVIQGHDGSLTVAFNDYRDNFLLELEKRIYNNIKVSYAVSNFDIDFYRPGYFRDTEYNRNEYTQLVSGEFLKWVGQNQLDFSTNSYFVNNDSFTWNYNQAKNVDNEYLPGYWRGIYRYYYDTDRPHTHPWEMLGFSIKPAWWDNYYSWTNNTKRTALIASITAGRVNPPDNSIPAQNLAQYARANFASFVPVDSSGNLRSPLEIIVKSYNGNNFNTSFTIGDQGPVESAWYRTPDYAFSLQKVKALMKPAEFFGRLIDTSRYRRNFIVNQFLVDDNENQRINRDKIVLNGTVSGADVARASGYINWILGYLTNLGLPAVETVRNYLDGMSVQLSYSLAGFSDKNLLTVIAEQYTPTSINQTVNIPDENYYIHLNRSVPLFRAIYSAVIVQKTSSGFVVNGYDTSFPYFLIVPSDTSGPAYSVSVLSTEFAVFQEGRDELLTIPYGTEFANRQQVVDFLVSYQRFLESQGFVFQDYDSDLGTVRDWVLSAREFVTWALQGWDTGNVLILGPLVDRIKIRNDLAVVDEITNRANESQLLGLNFNVIRNNEFNIVREDNLTTIYTSSGQTIGLADLAFIQFEHVVIVDNETVFGDIIYNPESGNRQFRLKLSGYKTSSWSGRLDIPGYVFNDNRVEEWLPGRDYSRGAIVQYKNRNYTALTDLVATTTFEVDSWSILDSVLTEGLLPNFAALASRSQNIYDIDSPPADENLARFSSALIGFRSRNYLDIIGLDSTTQPKFYQGYIRQKGSANSIRAIDRGDYGTENQIQVYEEWAARIGEYGAIDANPAINFVVSDQVFDKNPVCYNFTASRAQSTEAAVITISPDQLLNRPNDYNGQLFLNRNSPYKTKFSIELFGDGIMCGRDFSVSVGLDFAVCRNDKVTGRVSSPPDYLLYQALDSEFDLAITTRSVDQSTSGMLLDGTDGVNQAWPDDIESDIVVINHGLMDIKEGTPVFTYKAILRSLRNRLSSKKIVVWQTPTRVDTDNTNTHWNGLVPNVPLYARAMREVCAEYGDILADTHTITNWVSYLGTNGVYPNQQGYTALVNSVLAPAVRTALQRLIRLNYRDYEDDLVTAGYVHQNDVNAQVFDIGQITNNSIGILADITTGYKIWVARDFDQSWQVYRTYQNTAIVTECQADLDNKLVFITSQAHGLAAGDIFAIRNFDTDIDGFYQVSAATETSITVYATDSVFAAVADSTSAKLSTSSQLFDFTRLRFANRAARSQYLPKHNWLANDITWIDDSGDLQGRWTVERYQLPDTPALTTSLPVPNASAISFTVNNLHYEITGRYPNSAELDTYVLNISAGTLNYTELEEILKSSLDLNAIGTWTVLRTQNPRVDIDSVNNLYLYSLKDRRILTRLDILDPNKGRILGPALADIDFTTSIDPARYSVNSDTSAGTEFYWNQQQLGTYWWDVSVCRFVDYEQDTLTYRINNWSRLFPGSSVEVYEWISSDYTPSQYMANNEPGQPYLGAAASYSVSVYVDTESLTTRSRYYFWVRNHGTKLLTSKRLTTSVVESMIAAPDRQGIPYMAAIASDAIALYNVGSYLNGTDTVMYLSSQRELNENLIHSDFRLVQSGNPNTVIPARIEQKLLDSLIGADSDQNMVPDTNLLGLDRLGLGLRPRQTLLTDLNTARNNAVNYINSILIKFPITHKLVNIATSSIDNFFAEDPEPTIYDSRVETYADLVAMVPVIGANVLVRSDETQNNYWAVYRKTASGQPTTTTIPGGTAYAASVTEFYIQYLGRYPDQNGLDFWVSSLVNNLTVIDQVELAIATSEEARQGGISRANRLIKRQEFDITKYWQYQDWYAEGYSAATQATYTVDQSQDIETILVKSGDIVKVLNTSIDNTDVANSYSTVQIRPGQFELYRIDTGVRGFTKTLIGLGNGTVQISNVFNQDLGFDSTNFDNDVFDKTLYKEFRYILQGLKQDIFINELRHYYNDFLFYLINYILSEQRYIDWFFKTSLISIVHNYTGFNRNTNFIRDRQTYYEQYINEVKPYRTKVKDYVLNYNEVEQPRLAVTDFDLPGYYDFALEQFRSPSGENPSIDNVILNTGAYQDWNLNHTYQVSGIDIIDRGYGFRSAPDINILRQDSGLGAEAKATAVLDQLTNRINKVRVTTVGSEYTEMPLISVHGTGGNYFSDTEEYEFTVSSTGSNDTSGNVWGLFGSNASVIFNANARSYTMHRIRLIDGQVTFTRQYDIYNQNSVGFTGNTSADLADDLNNTTSDYAVIVHTYGEPQQNRLANGLESAMYRCGASAELFGSATTFRANSAYILAGIPGSGPGRGTEHYVGATDAATTAWCKLDFKIRQGHLIPVARTPRFFGLATAFSLPSPAAAGQVYNYASLSYVYSGQGWFNQNSRVTSITDNRPKQARLVARLANNTVRKIRTVIRFDRVSYTSQVYDFTSAGYDNDGNAATALSNVYPTGTLVSYQGQAYRITRNTTAANTLNLANTRVIGSDQPVTSARYLNGYFDNANDRIMSYYQPTTGMEPKILGRLVAGIDPNQQISTNLVVSADTILEGDTFSSLGGIAPANIIISGGGFLDSLYSYSPEEFVPGRTFDSLSIRVTTSNVSDQGYRKFVDFNGNVEYSDFIAVDRTVLAQNLNLTDGNIVVQDGSVLPVPDPFALIPGVIAINGERISYYSKVGNVLSQLRRGYQGTGAPLIHAANSRVENISGTVVSTPTT